LQEDGRRRLGRLFDLTTGDDAIRFLDRRSALAAALVVLFLSLAGPAGALSPAWPAPPSVEFGELFRAVEMAKLYPDQKTFADAIPLEPPAQVMADYDRQKRLKGFDLRTFVASHFQPPRQFDVFTPRPDESVRAYITGSWEALQRKPDDIEPFSSLLPLPRPYVVPGGRFSEIYYWDSYFTMVGLEQDGRGDLARDMLEDFASLIDRYGHVPNGARSYYLSRSQPPFFSLMVELVAARDGDEVFIRHLPELEAEYDYWMDGADKLAPGSAYRHAVRLPDGALLNRYWDDRAAPRDEAYAHDVETALHTNRAAAEVYRDLRAGAETGWDFSSRWLADGKNLWTIRTTDIAPVDLNALVFHLEQTLAKAFRLKGDADEAQRYEALAAKRGAAIQRLMWNGKARFFADYLWREGRQSDVVSAATAVPLTFGIATPDEAHAVAAFLRRMLLEPGGLGTTITATGQQWDRPNGWAPLQYLAIEGLNFYGERDLAREIAGRWISNNVRGYAATGALVEKYDVEQADESGSGGRGGEYPLQVGFGWTNGVLAKLMAEYPDLALHALRQSP
jgi:alpha,alpha-trehalase